MKRTLIASLAGLTALGIAGTAVAHGFDSGRKTSTVAATFSAAPASSISTRSCVGADGTYVITRGDWTGTATSANGRLSGPILIRGELGVNQTSGLGWLVGRVRIDGGSDGRNDAAGDIRAAIAGGKLTGFVSGRLRDQGYVYGSVAATVGTAGLTDGQIGGGTVNPVAIVIDQGSCQAVQAQKPVQEARGTVSAVSATSLTIARSSSDSLTCVVGSDLAATVAKLKVGDQATAVCGLVDNAYRLLRISSDVLNVKPVVAARGAVTALSATSLTVKDDGGSSVTCVIGTDFAAAAAKLAVGARVAVTCAQVDGSYRIVRLEPLTAPAQPVITATGNATAVSATSITVTTERGSQSCAVGTDLAAAVARVSTGDRIRITCGLVDGSYRLLSLQTSR